MRINMVSKQISVSDTLRARTEKKLGKLDRYFDDSTDVQVVVSTQKNRKIMEVTIFFDGGVLRAEESTDDMYTSLDKVLAKLERQVRKHRTKLERRLKPDAFTAVAGEDVALEDAAEEELGPIVKVKRFPLKPMSTEEATLQMELLGHAFFVFVNDDDKQVNVLYRRNEGGYGLLQPDYD